MGSLILICGWKKEMPFLVAEALAEHPQSQITVLARPGDEGEKSWTALLGTDTRARLMVGEGYSEQKLQEACVHDAGQVVVVADWALRETTASEADSESVMTAMAVRRLAPKVPLSVEVLDLDFLQYLRMAHVDEVILSREVSRILFANSVGQNGLSHIVAELVASSGGARLETISAESHWEGASLSELSRHVAQQMGEASIVLGWIENTASLVELKRQALAQAQKSPDTREVLKNLSRVKEIEVNKPVLFPGSKTRLPPNSFVIVLRPPVSEEHLGEAL